MIATVLIIEILITLYQPLWLNSFINTVTGFCDYEETTDLMYGNYTWIETFGRKTVSTKCAFKQDSNVTRKCLPYGDGWADIDFTACRTSK